MARIEEFIYESSLSKVFLVDSASYSFILPANSPDVVIMKVLNNRFPEAEEINRFYNEYDLLSDLSHHGIRKILAKTKFQNKHILFLEWFDGITIKQNGKVGVDDFLIISRHIVDALVALHAHRIVHRDISSNNVMVSPKSREVKVIDFGISMRIAANSHDLGFPKKCQGSLKFISPEQAGLLKHRYVDYRSDLYSIGILFYYMLVGKAPFEDNDKVTLLKKHLSHYATPVCEIDPSIPCLISDIIRKLMNKKPENRYQSAIGLQHDLNEIASQMNSCGKIDSNFRLARKDFLGRLELSDKLYSRKGILLSFLSSFDRAKKGGALEAFLVLGSPGTGKSFLINRLSDFILKRGGYFLRGSYNQVQSNMPYSAIINAIDKWCKHVRKLDDENQFNNLRKSIQGAVGEYGKLLTDVIKTLEGVIGEQPEIPEIENTDRRIRINSVFCNLIKAISLDKPLFLCFDDLQWADSASLELLLSLLSERDMKYVTLVIAFQTNETVEFPPTDNSHWSEISSCVHTVTLENLSKNDVNHLISDSLNTTQNRAAPLRDLVYSKTRGNAGCVIEFMTSLAYEKSLYFSYEKFAWMWNTEEIRKKKITDKVAKSILQKIDEYPGDSLNVLKIASCIEKPIEISALEAITELNVENLLREEFLQTCFIPTADGSKVSFSHASIQKTVYSTMPETERKTFHLIAGRILKKNLHPQKASETLFIVADQLNQCLELISDKNERNETVQLNLRAGEKALSISNFEKAAEFFAAGIASLDENHWQKDCILSLKLYNYSAEAEYCIGHIDEATSRLNVIFANTTSVLDTVQSRVIQIKCLRAQMKMKEALEVGLDVLQQLNQTFPNKPKKTKILLEFLKIRRKLWRKTPMTFGSMPLMQNEEVKAAMRIMINVIPSVVLTKPLLVPLTIFRMIDLCLKYGISEELAYAIAGYCQFKEFITTDHTKSYRLEKVSERILQRFSSKQIRCKVFFVLYSSVSHKKDHIHISIPHLQEASKIALEVGEVEYSIFISRRICAHQFLGGISLSSVEKELVEYLDLISTFKQDHLRGSTILFLQTVRAFMTQSFKDPQIEIDELLSKNEMQSFQEGNLCPKFMAYFKHAVFSYYFNQYEIAATSAKTARELLYTSPFFYENTNHLFYDGLILCQQMRRTKKTKKVEKILDNCIKTIRKLAKQCPENYLNKLHFLLAERAYTYGCDLDAMDYYELAIEESERQKFLHEEALACERAGIFYHAEVNKNIAQTFFLRACQVYEAWGAHAKSRQLGRLYGVRRGDRCPVDMPFIKPEKVEETLTFFGEVICL